MRPFILAAVLLSTAAFAQEDRAARAVPALAREPKLDGEAKKDFAKALALKKLKANSADLGVKVGTFKTSVFLSVEITDDVIDTYDLFDVMLQFPGAGVTAAGHTFRFALDGRRNIDTETAAPPWAQQLVKAAVAKTTTGMALEIELPARALPRFPATEPMVFDLCVTYEDRDAVGAGGVRLTNCQGGSMGKEALRLPDDFRKKLGLKPNAHATALEGRPTGWLGYGILTYPVWVQGDTPLTRALLEELVTDQAIDPGSADVNLPEELPFGKGRRLYGILSGRNPYAEAGKCDQDAELRIGLYVVRGREADRVLEWPGANCALGRATTVSLDDDGGLTIGYSNGGTVTFSWSGDRFERTEIGRR